MYETLQRLFRYKEWADDQLLKALGRQPGKAQVTELAIRALSHSFVVDRIFAAHLRGAGHGYVYPNLVQLPRSRNWLLTSGQAIGNISTMLPVSTTPNWPK